jgi:hypothetical protein
MDILQNRQKRQLTIPTTQEFSALGLVMLAFFILPAVILGNGFVKLVGAACSQAGSPRRVEGRQDEEKKCIESIMNPQGAQGRAIRKAMRAHEG